MKYDYHYPLEYFEDNEQLYPILSLLAAVVHSWGIAAASIEVDFGQVSLVQTPRRNRLHAAFFDIICMIYLHKNSGFFDKENFHNINKIDLATCNRMLTTIYLGNCETFNIMQGAVEVQNNVESDEDIPDDNEPAITYDDISELTPMDEFDEEEVDKTDDITKNIDNLIDEPLTFNGLL